MSFLGLRKSRHLTEPGYGDTLDDHHSTITRTPSIKSTNTFRQRLSSFNVFSPKRLRSHSSKKRGGIGYTASYQPSYAPSRSPSPEPSLEIRRPSGLGRRASITGEQSFTEEGWYPRPNAERKRSISTPELSLTRWSAQSETVYEDDSHKSKYIAPRLSMDLMKMALLFVARSDLPSVAMTCKPFLEVARARIYRDVNLLEIADQRQVDKCIHLLTSKRDVAALVESFSCMFLPPSHPSDATSPLPAVTFAIALNNMHNLTSLTLSRFDSALLFHTTFQLRTLSFLCETASQGELEGLFAWLTNQSTLTSLSFPHLTLDSESSQWFAGAGSQLTDIPEDLEESVSSSTFPPTLLPALSHICGSTSLATALVPGRPLTSVTLLIHTTIYDGLRPSALVAELSKSTATVASLAVVVSPRSRVDPRTVERVIMAAGAELGGIIKTLEVESSWENQVCAARLVCEMLTHNLSGGLQASDYFFAAISETTYSPSTTKHG